MGAGHYSDEAGALAILQLPVAQYPTIAPLRFLFQQTIRALMRRPCRIRDAGYRTEYERYR